MQVRELEASIAELHEEMARPEFYQKPKDELAQTQARLKSREAELEAAFYGYTAQQSRPASLVI